MSLFWGLHNICLPVICLSSYWQRCISPTQYMVYLHTSLGRLYTHTQSRARVLWMCVTKRGTCHFPNLRKEWNRKCGMWVGMKTKLYFSSGGSVPYSRRWERSNKNWQECDVEGACVMCSKYLPISPSPSSHSVRSVLWENGGPIPRGVAVIGDSPGSAAWLLGALLPWRVSHSHGWCQNFKTGWKKLIWVLGTNQARMTVSFRLSQKAWKKTLILFI